MPNQPVRIRCSKLLHQGASLIAAACLGSLLLFGCQPPSPNGALVVSTIEPVSTTVPSEASRSAAADQPVTSAPAIAGKSASPAAQSGAAPTAQTGAAAFSAQRALGDVRQLADGIGSRVAGSPAQDRAAAYLAGQLEAAGLTTEKQAFTFPAFQDRGSTLAIVAPHPMTLQTQTLAYSPGGEIEGEVVYVDLARDGDFTPADVRGKVALANRGEIRFGEKVANLAAAGATAVIIANNQPGNFGGSLTGRGELPVVSLSQEDGARLATLIKSGTTMVRLKVDSGMDERTGLNVIGTKSGSEHTVVIGAHYDSVSAGPGANDNGSGTATLLELARVVAGRQYPFTVRFVAFDAEELGLLGSRYYVSQLGRAERGGILAMINLDMVGVGDRLSFGGDPDLVERGVRQAGEAGVAASRLRGGGAMGSDHSSFLAVGIPSLFVYRSDDPHYHTAEDRSEYVSAAHLGVAGRVVLGLLDDLAVANP
jgi:aminopeptidase YwaD